MTQFTTTQAQIQPQVHVRTAEESLGSASFSLVILIAFLFTVWADLK